MKKINADENYRLLKEKLEEVSLVTPQNIGALTPFYKKTTSFLKNTPWKIVLPVSFLLSVVLFRLSGLISIKIVSVLQSAF